jgi:NAD(P)-dependent dehydrogenase (short-subunit alcohol dehydrogenase family)
VNSSKRVTVVTGGASGIGRAVVERLRQAGGEVFVIDLRSADAKANLSAETGRETAAAAVETRYPGGIDCIMCCAGIGATPDQGALTTSVNFFGTTRLLDRLRPLLAKGRSPRAVITASSMSLHPPDEALLALMLDDDEGSARAHTNDTMVSYTTGKRALCHWVRRTAAQADWAGAGILLNGVAPGLIRTPLTKSLDDPEGRTGAAQLTPLALTDYPGPEAVAPLYEYLGGPLNTYLVGQVIYADGGSDVLLRGEAVP